MQTKRSIFSLFLALTLCLTMLPTTVLATEDPSDASSGGDSTTTTNESSGSPGSSEPGGNSSEVSGSSGSSEPGGNSSEVSGSSEPEIEEDDETESIDQPPAPPVEISDGSDGSDGSDESKQDTNSGSTTQGGSSDSSNTQGSGNQGETQGDGNQGDTQGNGNQGDNLGDSNQSDTQGETQGDGNQGETQGDGNQGETQGDGNQGETQGDGNQGETQGDGNQGNTQGSGSSGEESPTKTVTVTFDANGGTLAENATTTTQTTDTTGKLSAMPDNPTYSGYTFAGWYTDATAGDEVTTDTVHTEDTTVYAHWEAVKEEEKPERPEEPEDDPNFFGDTYQDSGAGQKLSQEEIKKLLADNSLQLPATLFETQPSYTVPYTIGKVNPDALQAAVDRLNALRTIAGLPSVTLDATLSENVQYNAVLNAINGTISHEPKQPANMDDDFYKRAAKAATGSNLSAGSTLTKAVDSFMNDSDKGNVSRVGHRRWQLNPKMGKVGFGYATTTTGYRKYTSEWSVDQSGSGCDYAFIAWPASGNFPRDVFGKNIAWSVSMNPSRYETPALADIKVTLLRESDQQTWTFSGDSYTAAGSGPYFTVDTLGYGVNNCIIFRPGGITEYDGTYTVTIEGLKTKKGNPTTLTYQVTFFNAASSNNPSDSSDPTNPTNPTDQPDKTGQYTITLNANGGTLAGESTMTTTNSKLTSLPANPTRSDYTFDGWYTSITGGTKITTSHKFTGDATIYAHWTQNTITIAFDANGGLLSGSSTITTNPDGTLPRLPSEPTFPNYTFKGWFLPFDTLPITTSYHFQSNAVVYAKWEKETKKEEKGDHIEPIVHQTNPLLGIPVLTDRPDDPTAELVFADVPADAYYTNAVRWTIEKGIASGTTATTFSPAQPCTRAQTVTFLWRAAGEPNPTSTENPFVDVQPNAYYYKAVLWANENHITSGITPTTFCPSATVTRAQTVTFLYRNAGSPAIHAVQAENPFQDVESEAYYIDAVQWAVANNITSGTSATTFEPREACTRGQIVTFLYRAQ